MGNNGITHMSYSCFTCLYLVHPHSLVFYDLAYFYCTMCSTAGCVVVSHWNIFFPSHAWWYFHFPSQFHFSNQSQLQNSFNQIYTLNGIWMPIQTVIIYSPATERCLMIFCCISCNLIIKYFHCSGFTAYIYGCMYKICISGLYFCLLCIPNSNSKCKYHIRLHF